MGIIDGGKKYSKHINLLENASVVNGAIYIIKSKTENGYTYSAGSTEITSSWNYYFIDIHLQTGKTLYYGYSDASTVGGMAFLNVYGQIIKAYPGEGNTNSLVEGSITIPDKAHYLILDFMNITNIFTQNAYAYVVVENSNPEDLTLIKESVLTDLADSIREKLKVFDKYKPSEMAEAIDLIDSDVFLSGYLQETEKIAEGYLGTCKWELTRKGVLFLHEGELPFEEENLLDPLSEIKGSDFNLRNVNNYKSTKKVLRPNSYWYTYQQSVKVRLLVIDGPVKVKQKARGLFSNLTSLWLIAGIGNLDFSDTEDISFLFSYCSELISIDLSNNDFSNITNMDSVFLQCQEIREIILPNNINNVKTIEGCFSSCLNLVEIDLSSMNESLLTNIYALFNNCQKLSSIILNWQHLEEVVFSGYLFWQCASLEEIDLSNWTTSSKLKVCKYMFYQCKKIKQINLQNWDLSGCVEYAGMFQDCSSLTTIVTSDKWRLNIDNINNYANWLKNCTASLDTSDWRIDGMGTSLKSFFSGWMGEGVLNLNYWDTSNIKDMSYMFQNCRNLTGVNLEDFEFSAVTTMQNMFQNCNKLQWDLLTFPDNLIQTENLKNISYMFQSCSSLKEFYFPFSIVNVEDMSYFLSDCWQIRKISFGNGILDTWFDWEERNPNKERKDKDGINGLNFLQNCGNIQNLEIGAGYRVSLFQKDKSITLPVDVYKTIDENNLDIDDIFYKNSPLPDGGGKFTTCGALTSGSEVNIRLKKFLDNLTMDDTSIKVTTLDSKVKKIIFDTAELEISEDLFDLNFYVPIGKYYNYGGAYASFDIDTGELFIFTLSKFIFLHQDSSWLFSAFTALQEIEFHNLQTITCTNIQHLFDSCKTLLSIDLSFLNSKNITTMSYMFNMCFCLERIDFSCLDIMMCESLSHLCEKCYLLEEIVFFNKPYMFSIRGDGMFSNCTGLKRFIQPELDTSVAGSFNFYSLSKAFEYCASLEEIILPNWGVTNLTTCDSMFQFCLSLIKIDISNWTFTNQLTTLERMFWNCPVLQEIDFNYNIDPIVPEDISYMFYNCRQLGKNQIGPNGERNYFKLLPIKLQNILSIPQEIMNATNDFSNLTLEMLDQLKLVQAKYVLAGCEAIEYLDLSALEILPDDILGISHPVLTYFCSAWFGKDGSYLLNKIAIGANNKYHFVGNNTFIISNKITPSTPDVRYRSLMTGEFYYCTRAEIEDIYEIVYPEN